MEISTARRSGRVRLRTEIFLWTLVLCVVQAFIIGLTFFCINTKTLFETEKDNITQLLNVVNQDIESRVESFNSIALDIVINDEIKKNLNITGSLEAGRARSLINEFLANKTLSAQGLMDLSIIDRKNSTYSTRAVYHLPTGFRMENSESYKSAAHRNGALVWLTANNIISSYGWDSDLVTRRMPGLRASAVIKDYNRGEVLGLLMLSVKENYFYEINYSNRKLEKVRMYLVSPDRSLILPVAGTKLPLAENIPFLIDPGNKRNTIITEDESHNVVSYIYNNAMGWYLVSITEASEINRLFVSLIKVLIITLLFSIAASMLLSWWSTKFFTNDIAELADKMKLVEKGNFDIQVHFTRRDEIGWLAEVFNNMVQKIKILIETTYKQAIMTRDAEFRALQAQINPHFLYNTLDMINWRLLAAGQDELSSSVVALGNLLRYSISADDVVSLSNEIQNMEDYIILRQSNKDPVFEYSKIIENISNFKLPKLTLQPLVENAIIHGFGRRQNGNTLSILAILQEKEVFRIKISDNGIGMNKDTCNKIMDDPHLNRSNNPNRKMHIGIRNVDKRLKHMYGDSFGLSIESETGKGTTVTITLPSGNGSAISEDFSK